MKYKGEEVEEPPEGSFVALYKGNGTVTFNDTSYNCKFIIWQNNSGKIRGKMAEFDEAHVTDLSRPNVDIGTFTGTVESGTIISCDKIYVYGKSPFFNNVGPSDFLLTIGAHELEISNPKVNYENMSGIYLDCGLLNIDLRRILIGKSNTNLGTLWFSRMMNHEEMINQAKLSHESVVTGIVHIRNDNINPNNIDEYLTSLNSNLSRLCYILSIAKTTFIDYSSFSLYIMKTDSEKMPLLKEIIREPKTRSPSYGRPLIEDLADFYSFIEHGLENYVDDLNSNYYFDIALEWYLSGASSDIVQMDFVHICVFLETIKHKHALLTETEFIIEPESFTQYKDELINQSREILGDMGYSGEEHKAIRGSYYANLGGINRWPFIKGLKDLLEALNLKYDDLTEDLNKIAEYRNKIVHSGIEKDPNVPTDIVDLLWASIALSQRIILRLLNYEGYFLDCNDKFKRKLFTDYIKDN